ncbi:Organelle RRM domain-containing protein 1, chloroplastic [Sesamum alatum]|uniref:Organelle RRM domain-containing protein 1, chloroplastic n=1 Tax=Sesamum alatum TaxID=300844 RepID=A0AAE2CKX1_9LAMI|nr:Organelle RRM domain-containing protein 1, chloroplastic [Sesamum alatum]
MALFSSPCKPPIMCPKFHRIRAIQTPFSSKSSISKTSNLDAPRISISAPAKLINTPIQKAQFRSSLSSPAELDEGIPSSVIIFVKGLSQSTSEGGLKAAFSQFGEVSRVKVITDKKTKQSLGFAYVWFTREEHARAALEEMNGKFFEGRFLYVSIAKPGSCKSRPKPTPYKF